MMVHAGNGAARGQNEIRLGVTLTFDISQSSSLLIVAF